MYAFYMHQQVKAMSGNQEVFGEPSRQSTRISSGLEDALGTARALLFFLLEPYKSDPRARAWIASLESMLDYAHHCLVPASSAPTVSLGTTVPAPAPLEEEQPEDPHGKKPMEPPHEGTG